MLARGALALAILGVALLATRCGLAQTPAELDEQLLKSAGLATDDKGLLDFFRRRSLKDGDRERLTGLVRLLGSNVFRERQHAGKELVLQGPLALPFLKSALKNADLETRARANQCINEIEKSMGPEHPAAAARLLALRKVPGAIDALFNYIPYANDAWSEEEILASLGQLAVRQGKIDPLLTAALKDAAPPRRAAAVYVLARRDQVEQRDTIRQFLGDPSPLVAQRAAEGLVGKPLFKHLEDAVQTDEKLLKDQQIGTDHAALLDLVRKRTLTEEDQARLRALVRQLGAVSFRERDDASKKLIDQGPPALVFLMDAAQSGDLETSRRAQICIEKIKTGPGPVLPAAAIRLLARPIHKSAAAIAIRDLLALAPFAEDPTVEEEILNALCVLSVREPRVEPLLLSALEDKMPARRAAAALVLGRVGTREHLPGVHRLVADKSPAVRLRVAQGLLAAHDKSAVPLLIGLLAELKNDQLWQAEDLLHRLAGDTAPSESVTDIAKGAKEKAIKAWEAWHQASADKVDLSRLTDGDAYLGLTTIVEYDSATGRPGGQVWECGRDGKPRWKITGLLGPMDAQVLANGRVLIAENSAMQVTERDLQGNIKWQFRTEGGNPIAAQRLPNGNTFIATYNQVMEITPAMNEVYKFGPQNKGPQFYIFSAQKLRNGHVLCMTAQGVIMEFDPIANRDIHTIPSGVAGGGWCGVHGLANGRYLVATMNNGQVRELDAAGKSYASFPYQGAFRATRLPNGHTLVASMTSKRIAEFDRGGQFVRDISCEGRPWMVRYR